MTPLHFIQIEAHTGGVNDLGFSQRNKQLCVITCGDDKTIKVVISLENKLNRLERAFPYVSQISLIPIVNYRCGMPLLVLSNTHLRVMMLLYILCALTLKKTFR